MAEYYWPSKDKATVIGKPIERIDGLPKSTGAAKYTYDVNPKRLLFAKALGAPHAHLKITSLDIAAAQKVPGVVHIDVLRKVEGEVEKADAVKKGSSEVEWEGELLAVVAAESEAAAAEGVAAINLKYDKLDVFVTEEDLAAAEKAERTGKAGGKVVTQREPGDDDDEDEFVDKELQRLFKDATHIVEGYYGVDVITHCCLEPHGTTAMWEGDNLLAYLSTQNVSGTDDEFARDLKITPDQVETRCDYIGGGFGSKFRAGYWGLSAARIAKATGRPVKFMLSRDQELKIAGNRPSGYIKVKMGADKDGLVTVWDSHHWGTAGKTGRGVAFGTIPYVFSPPNYRTRATRISTNAGPQAAWRAPNHPQACAMSQTAFDDMAMKMGIDSYDLFMKNLALVSGDDKAKPELYAEEMKVAAGLMDWKAKWHKHGKGTANGSLVDGLGMALHTWQGIAGGSSARVKIYPSGGVESFCGTQDLGTGTRTICAQVLAETFGLTVNDVKVNIGTSKYPVSGGSGGSTTVGGVSNSHRRAAQDALVKVFESCAGKLDSKAEDLEAVGGRVRVKGKDRSISWKEACASLGMKPLEVSVSYQRGQKGPLSGERVGGVQMAHVVVDRDTGVVKVKKFVAVQDIGLVMNPKTAESQVRGAAIMGIAYALFEQRIMDPTSGVFLNAEMRDYKLPRLGDIGEIVVQFHETEEQRKRGVIGLGEPPVISPGAAISNAVCNALGVRVPVLPMTPKRVLDAIRKQSGRA